jgi:hypothetical protein
MKSVCKVLECKRPIANKKLGMCDMHAQRFKRNGTTDRKNRSQAEFCSVIDCDARAVAGSLCSKHHHRFVRYGDPMYINPRRIVGSLRASFEAKYEVCERTGCWNWRAGVNNSGYGMMAPTEWGTLAHRISYGLHVGPIPKGKGPHGTCVCHRCDNRLCVNPEHLFLGSNADNIADRDKKGRQVTLRGAKNVNAKLTDADVIEIRAMFESGAMLREVSERFSISKANASDIKRGRIWAHVKDIE